MLNRIRILAGIAVALFTAGVALSPSLGEDVGPPPFRAYVDMKTFMEHVLTPAAKIVWSVNGVVIDEKGEHDLSPKTDDDWERVVSGAATLAEATNALMIPERALDPAMVALRQGIGGRRKQGLSGSRGPRSESDLASKRSARRHLRRLSPPLWGGVRSISQSSTARLAVILRWPRSGPRRMNRPGRASFEARCARASG